MSSHYLYVTCGNCNKQESIYTGDIETYEFDDADWEEETIHVSKCKECKETLT